MFFALLAGLVGALIAPYIEQITKKWTGWILALLPAGLFVYYASLIPRLAESQPLIETYSWVPTFGINLSFRADGLSVLFAMIISGVGTFIVIYAGGYLKGHPFIGRFYLFILAFMTAMLGVVTANDIISLFVFWELTSLTSYMLIGFNHEEEKSRKSALQALIVTGGGGLALLAGLIMLGIAGGSFDLTTLLENGDAIRSSYLYPSLLILILLGAFTKSAQFPFHFWLPNAMAAPTPVSAYLHSATMVKAGVFLLARLSPALGETLMWQVTVTAVGVITMVLGAYLSWQNTDLKRILAYSTVSALGTLTMLIGLGDISEYAIEAMVMFLVVHSLYKGALFMVAGSIDHEAGTRDINVLGGLWRLMPMTWLGAILGALSMGGILPIFLGYVGKKLMYEATLDLDSVLLVNLLTGLTVLTNIMMVMVAGLVALRPFLGKEGDPPKHAHEAPLSMWLGPLALGITSIVLVIINDKSVVPLLIPDYPLKDVYFAPLMDAAATATLNLEEMRHIKIAMWSPLEGLVLFAFPLSIITIVGGFIGYGLYGLLRQRTEPFDRLQGPETLYWRGLDGMMDLARWQTNLLQRGYLPTYLLVVIVTMVGLTGITLVNHRSVRFPTELLPITWLEVLIVVLILAGVVVTLTTNSRLTAVAGLGVTGFGVATVFILFSAPDLAMTQFAIETLTVILFVLVLYRLPDYSVFDTISNRWRDGLVAIIAGGLITTLVLIVLAIDSPTAVTDFFALNSYAEAQGRNVVNVILVDFRALDTMGEIIVLAVAASGVFTLLKLKLGKVETGTPAAVHQPASETDISPKD